MNAGCLVQGLRKIELREIRIIDHVVVAAVSDDATAEIGDASLVIDGVEHAGVVTGFSGAELTFRPEEASALARLVDPPKPPDSEKQPDGDLPEPAEPVG
jgi:hypothetical protein